MARSTKLDEVVDGAVEQATRVVNRRQFMSRMVHGVFTAVATVAAGSVVDVKEAFAQTCSCGWYGGSGNANCANPGGTNYGCNTVAFSGGSPQSACKSPLALCTQSSGGCAYISGWWVSCSTSSSYRACVDCWRSGTSYKCTCLTASIKSTRVALG